MIRSRPGWSLFAPLKGDRRARLEIHGPLLAQKLSKDQTLDIPHNDKV